MWHTLLFTKARDAALGVCAALCGRLARCYVTQDDAVVMHLNQKKKSSREWLTVGNPPHRHSYVFKIPTAHYSDDWTIYCEKDAFKKAAVSRVSVGVAEHRLYGVAPKRHPPGELMSGVSGRLSNAPEPRRNLPVTSICCIWAVVACAEGNQLFPCQRHHRPSITSLHANYKQVAK